jgi:hypothetical protein
MNLRMGTWALLSMSCQSLVQPTCQQSLRNPLRLPAPEPKCLSVVQTAEPARLLPNSDTVRLPHSDMKRRRAPTVALVSLHPHPRDMRIPACSRRSRRSPAGNLGFSLVPIRVASSSRSRAYCHRRSPTLLRQKHESGVTTGVLRSRELIEENRLSRSCFDCPQVGMGGVSPGALHR